MVEKLYKLLLKAVRLFQGLLQFTQLDVITRKEVTDFLKEYDKVEKELADELGAEDELIN